MKALSDIGLRDQLRLTICLNWALRVMRHVEFAKQDGIAVNVTFARARCRCR